jgi:N-acetylglucosaminyldiphosphoundecaprenol N-acetyl-beta-D-mannosaminyltransferase
MSASCAFAQTATAPAGWAGSGDNVTVYEIATPDSLFWLSQAPDAWNESLKLTADIDATSAGGWHSDAGLMPIGNETINSTGSFDGDGYVIAGLTINRPELNGVGMFGCTSGASSISSLGLESVSVTGGPFVGGLVGSSSGSITSSLRTCVHTKIPIGELVTQRNDRCAVERDCQYATMKISVVIPVRNRWPELIECLRSIENQTYNPTEVVVVDDGSIDPVVEKLGNRNTPLKMHFVRQNPMGIAVARNTGIRACIGDLILFIDSDCMIKRDFLQEVAQCVLSHPEDVAFQTAFAPACNRMVWLIDSLARRAKQEVLQTSCGHIGYLDTAGFALRRDYAVTKGELFLASDIRGEDTSLLARLVTEGMLPRFVPRAQVEHHPSHSLIRYLTRHFAGGYYASPARARLQESTSFLMDGAKRTRTLSAAWRCAQSEHTGRLAFCLLLVGYVIEICGRAAYAMFGMRPGHTEILGVSVACVRSVELQEEILQAAHGRSSKCFTYLTAWTLVLAQRHPVFKDHLERFTVRYADGMGVVLTTLLLSRRRIHKVTANDFFPKLCHELSRRELSIALVGGTPTVLDSARRELAMSVPGLQIVLCSSGYLSERQEESLISDISQAKPHLVVLSMGQPLQEAFALRIRKSFPDAAFLCVGSLFEIIAGELPSPPRIIRVSGFEWFYRLCHSPRRMWRRYLVGLPVLAGYIFLALLLPIVRRLPRIR